MIAEILFASVEGEKSFLWDRAKKDLGGWIIGIENVEALRKRLEWPVWGIFVDDSPEMLQLVEKFHLENPQIPIGYIGLEKPPEGFFQINNPGGYVLFIGHLYNL